MITIQHNCLRLVTLLLLIALAACSGGGGGSSGSTSDTDSGSGSDNAGSQNDNEVGTSISSGTAVASPKPVPTNTSSSPSVEVISYKNVARPGGSFNGQLDFRDSDGNVEEIIVAEKGENSYNRIPVASAGGISDGTIDFEIGLSNELVTEDSIALEIGLRDSDENVSNYNTLELALSEETRYATTSYTGDFVPDVEGNWDVELVVKEPNPKFPVGTVLQKEMEISQSGRDVVLTDSNGSVEGRIQGTESLLTITYEGTIDLNSQGVDAFVDFWATFSGEMINADLIEGESNSIIQRLYGDEANTIEVYSVATDAILTRSSSLMPGDDGDSFSTASSIMVEESYNREIASASDQDYFTFDIDSEGKVTVTLENLTADLDIELYDFNENFLASSENLGISNEEITYNIGIAGPYYIKVFGFGGATSPYTLSVSSVNTVLLYAVADSYVSDNSIEENYGNEPDLYTGEYLSAFRTFVGFDISEVPSDASIQKGLLYLVTTRNSVPCGQTMSSTVNISQVVGTSWTETGLTYVNKPVIFRGLISQDVDDFDDCVSHQRSFDVTEAVKDWVSGSSENRGLSIKSSSLSSPGFYAFYSREVSPDAGPRLYIEYS